MSSGAGKRKDGEGEERRRAKRMLVSEAFSCFIVIPNKSGMSRVYLKDLSASGLRFLAESAAQFSAGAELKIRLYTGPALFLPLTVKVVRASGSEVAVELLNRSDKAAEALGKFLAFLEAAADAAVLEQQNV